MAVVRRLEKRLLETVASHSEVHASYALIRIGGEVYLQVDTYGSRNRKIKDKQSQSIRFAPEAIEQLRQILERELDGPTTS